MFENNNPFEEINFVSQPDENPVDMPFASADDIVRILGGSTQQNVNYIPQKNTSPMIDGVAVGDTTDGASRVNKNTAQTGVVAYKDDKGRTTLTNVARDPLTNQEKPIAALLRAAPEKSQTPLGVQDALLRLQKSESVGEAQSIYNNFQQAVAGQRAALEQEAFNFAERKLGIKELEQQLMQARQLDKQDAEYLPGMGDSPITQKIVNQLLQSRQFADNEAKNFLSQNAAYRGVLAMEETGKSEYRRVQLMQDRISVNAANFTERNAQKQEMREEQMLEKFEGISARQLARIETLHVADLANFGTGPDGGLAFSGDPEMDKRRKLKIISLLQNNGKDKDYQAAIMAEGTPGLFKLSLAGNQYAKQLVIAEEARATGLRPAEVAQQITRVEQEFLKNGRNQAMMMLYKGDPQKAKMELGNLNAGLSSLDQKRKTEASQQNADLMMMWAQDQKTKSFQNDVRNWKLDDPIFNAAVEKAVKITGKSDVSNVLVAYLDGVTDDQKIAKLKEFDRHLTNAALKHKDSMFGMPDIAPIRSMMVQEAISKQLFTKMIDAGMKKIAGIKVPLQPVLDAASTGAGYGLFGIAGLPFGPDAKPPIDPETGRPLTFGQ